jgi:MoaA/NifB/PqqE/SkfB family radical SAM enzyme
LGFIKNRVESFLLRQINVDRYLPIQIDITNACNLRCVHCYHPHHKNEGAISLDDWRAILLQYKTLVEKMKYRPAVVICGGEPLLSPMLNPLLEFVATEMTSATISILTNGTLVTEKMALGLQKFSNLQFQVSLDGPDSDRHDIIRGKGNFDKALAGIRVLKANGFAVTVLSVLSKRTVGWMEDFFRLAKVEKFDSINFVRFVMEGMGRKLVENEDDQPLLGLELKVAYEDLLRLMLKYQVKSKTQGPLFDLVLPGLGRSGKFWESIVIDFQGYVIASSRAKLRLGHAIRDGVENIFLNHELYRNLRRGRVDVCGDCSLYGVCGGDRNAAFAASGNFLGQDPGCWKVESKQILKGAV